jgi:hypothetical protein
MDANTVRDALVEVLQEIQTASGMECPVIAGTTNVVALAEAQPPAPVQQVKAR